MIFLIGLGGICGAFARYYWGKWVAAQRPLLFPWATFMINISGSLILGILFSLHSREILPDLIWMIFGTGFCGAYTTFSTLGYETIMLIEKKKILNAFWYVLLSTIIGLLFAWVGMIMSW